MGSQTFSTTAFVLSLLGGIIIVLGGFLSLLFYYNDWTYGGMMGGWHWMMGGYGYVGGSYAALSIVGLISGIIVIIGSLMLNARPAEHRAWGIVILVFSLVSFLGMGGFMIGALLGIAGGALALTYKPTFKQ